MSSTGITAEPIGNFDQPILPIGDPTAYAAVRSAVERSFSSANVAQFLKLLQRAGVRIRGFEAVLEKGLLGEDTRGAYGKLQDADQGQIREYYLASLEQVAPELRTKFFKLYAYY